MSEENKVKIFTLNRKVDVSGVSGIGIVATGIIFKNKKVVICWEGKYQSIVHWDCIEDVEKINCHNGSTTIEYIN